MDSKFCHELELEGARRSELTSPTGSFDPLWAQIRAETQLDASSEPILSSYLYACVLSHDTFEQVRCNGVLMISYPVLS